MEYSFDEASSFQFSSVARVWLFATPHPAERQASLSSPPPGAWLMSIESVIPSNYLILCQHLLLLPSIFPRVRVCPSESVPASGGQSIWALALASVLLMNIKDWFPLGLTALISLQSKGLSRVFSNTTVQKQSILQCSAFFMVHLISIHDHWKNHSFD